MATHIQIDDGVCCEALVTRFFLSIHINRAVMQSCWFYFCILFDWLCGFNFVKNSSTELIFNKLGRFVQSSHDLIIMTRPKWKSSNQTTSHSIERRKERRNQERKMRERVMRERKEVISESKSHWCPHSCSFAINNMKLFSLTVTNLCFCAKNIKMWTFSSTVTSFIMGILIFICISIPGIIQQLQRGSKYTK